MKIWACDREYLRGHVRLRSPLTGKFVRVPLAHAVLRECVKNHPAGEVVMVCFCGGRFREREMHADEYPKRKCGRRDANA